MEEEIYRLNVTTSEGKFNLTNLDFKDPLNVLLFRQTMYKQMGSKAHFYLKVSNRGISEERMEMMISSIREAVSNTIFFSEIPLVIGSLRIVEYDPEEAVSKNLPNVHKSKIPTDTNEEPLLAYKSHTDPRGISSSIFYSQFGANAYLQPGEQEISDANLSRVMEYIVRLCRVLRACIQSVEVPRMITQDELSLTFNRTPGSIFFNKSTTSLINESTPWVKEMKELWDRYSYSADERYDHYPIYSNPFPKKSSSDSSNCSLL